MKEQLLRESTGKKVFQFHLHIMYEFLFSIFTIMSIYMQWIPNICAQYH